MKRIRFFWVMILGFVLIILSACGGGGGGGDSTPSSITTTVIGPTGGSATAADGNATIQVPAGALSASTAITVTIKEDSYGQIGNGYQIEQQGGAGLSFSNPVIVKVQYDPSSLPSGAKESELRLALLNPYDSFEFLSDSTVDSINHTVTATTTHFSDVALLPQLPVGAPPTLAFPLHNSNGPFDAAITSVFDHSMDPTKPYYADRIVKDYRGEIGNASPDPNFSVTVVNGQSLSGYSNPSISQFVVNGNYTGGSYLYYDGHPGYDYKTVSTQVPSGQIDVFAAADGIAHVAGPKYGTIWIDHGNGYSTWYLHLSQRLAGDNKPVKKGDRIGVSGNTAPFYVGPHLHFEVKKNYVPIDPYSENLWETLSKPSAPTGITVTASSSTQIDLSWTAATGTVTGYKIYKNGTYLKSVTSTSTSDTGLGPATNYCYSVTAYNSAGESAQTDQICTTTNTATTAGVSGSWYGNWDHKTPAGIINVTDRWGIIIALLNQNALLINGYVKIEDWSFHCFNYVAGNVSGSISGNSVAWSLASQAGARFDFSGMLSGNTISGTYSIIGGACNGESGTGTIDKLTGPTTLPSGAILIQATNQTKSFTAAGGMPPYTITSSDAQTVYDSAPGDGSWTVAQEAGTFIVHIDAGINADVSLTVTDANGAHATATWLIVAK